MLQFESVMNFLYIALSIVILGSRDGAKSSLGSQAGAVSPGVAIQTGSDAESASRVGGVVAPRGGGAVRSAIHVEETCSSIEPPSDVDTDLGPQEDPEEEREEEEEEEDPEKSKFSALILGSVCVTKLLLNKHKQVVNSLMLSKSEPQTRLMMVDILADFVR